MSASIGTKLDTDLVYFLQNDLSLLRYASSLSLASNGLVDLYKLLDSLSSNPFTYNAKISAAIKNLGISDDLVSTHKEGNRVVYSLPLNESLRVFESIARNGLVYGYGVNDVEGTIYLDNGKIKPCYRKWCGMLERCYSAKWHAKKPSYKDCLVSIDWVRFSSFKAWFDEHNNPDYVLDKDILIKGNKIYSKETCVFVPEFINSLFIKRQGDRGELPIGVTFHQREEKYIARISAKNVRIQVGRFDCPQKAFFAYKDAKEKYIKDVAAEYYAGRLIDKRVFDALCRYEVGLDD
jgi:hypothetical protein